MNTIAALNAYNKQMKVAMEATSIKEDDSKGTSFASLLENVANETISAQNTASRAQMDALTGKGDVTELVTAIANAELALNTIVTVRDKVISAYQDIIRMPI